MPRSLSRRRRGFTLIEALLVISIVSIIGAVAVPSYRDYKFRYDLSIAESQLRQALSRARLLSMSGEGQAMWGVSVPEATIFQGNAYAIRALGFDEQYPFPDTVTVSGLQEVTFTQVSGYASMTGTILLTIPTGDTREIDVGPTQRIAQASSTPVTQTMEICENGETLTIPANEWTTHEVRGSAQGACNLGLSCSTGYRNTNITRGMLLLNASKGNALAVSGGATISTTGFVDINSNHPEASHVSGGSVTATEIAVVGGAINSGGGQYVGIVTTGVIPFCDPLAALPAPAEPTPVFPAQNITSSVTLQPGTYTGGITVSGKNTIVTMQPGIYYMKGGGFRVSGGATINGNGIMIYNAPTASTHQINISGGSSTINLTPPTSGTYKGIILYQTQSSTTPLYISGGGNVNIVGTVYAKSATLNMSGNGANIGSVFIGDSIVLSGNGSITMQ